MRQWRVSAQTHDRKVRVVTPLAKLYCELSVRCSTLDRKHRRFSRRLDVAIVHAVYRDDHFESAARFEDELVHRRACLLAALACWCVKCSLEARPAGSIWRGVLREIRERVAVPPTARTHGRHANTEKRGGRHRATAMGPTPPKQPALLIFFLCSKRQKKLLHKCRNPRLP